MKSTIILATLLVIASTANSGDNDFSYKNRSEVRPGDYLFQHQGMKKDPVFDEYRSVDLGINLGIGSDCGRVDFKNTLQASLKNILDSRYFGDMGKDIMAGSPMLVACYFSPTWCAILKHSQINANFMSQMRLNQYALMDKFVDSRVGDFYEERQACVHKEIEKNGGNIETAMQTCNSSRMWDTDLTNWAGAKYGEKSESNKLIQSSARWAGLDTPESSSTIKLVQSLVGDTVVSRGKVSVDYGDKPFGLTPRTHLASIERDIQDRLCNGFLSKIDQTEPGQINSIIRDTNLNEITGKVDQTLLDRQTLRNLAVIPLKTRSLYCLRLSNSIALSRFTEEMNRSLDVLTIASQNPNLPDRRRKEISDKRDSLKQSVDATLDLQKERNSPLNQVVAQINQEGSGLRQDLTNEAIRRDGKALQLESMRTRFFDCSDGIMCGENRKDR